MIAEIAAANAAFGVLKQALSSGKELYDCASAATQFFDNKSVIAKRVAEKGQSDLQAFMALEKIKEQEVWLKEYMIYCGRADMFQDWLAFQSECRKEREKKERLRKAKKAANLKIAFQFITIIGIAAAVVPVIIYIIMLIAGN
jgi:hypothetical protein